MKKLLVLLMVFTFVITLSACITDKPGVSGADEYQVSQTDVTSKVTGWDLFTNPGFRYEIRFPESYGMESDGEGGKLLKLYKEEENINLALLFRGHINFVNNYTLEEFYQNESENLFDLYEYEDAKLDGETAVLFKNVEKNGGDQIIDLMAIDRQSSIVEIEIYDTENEDIKTILNSVNFY
ncbi:hypothetical protein HOB30_05005, partial [Candidatus Falkowbacteria bacterium]|nr:hypothetical protein [Candidatus Falkowbacteria bacterium]